MENIVCNLCAGSPEIDLYKINLTKQQEEKLGRKSPIKTDICIGKEIELLINNNIITYGCCCGHGIEKPTCLIGISDIDKLKNLNYNFDIFANDSILKVEVKLKTNIQQELRKVLQNKVWRYLEHK